MEKIPSFKKPFALVIAGVVLIFLWVFVSRIVVNVPADKIVVVQNPFTGTLTWHTTPGPKFQELGTYTKYLKRGQFWFSAKPDQGRKTDESIKIRFNDGGHATISGSIAYEMPLDKPHLDALHMKYGSDRAIEQQLVRTVIEKAVYMAGPLMSSTESYSEKRNELLTLIEDQIQRGVYRTETIQDKKPDPMTGLMKTVNIVKIMFDQNTKLPLRAEPSPLQDFGIKTFNLSINEINYDPEVEKQIQQQQKALMQVQIAAAQAKEAEQNAITVGKRGEADAAKAKWEQEVIKAKAVTEGEQKLRVAELAAKEAEQYKRAEILKGEGEATRRKLVMEADNALEIKIGAYERVMSQWAEAASKYQGNWVPVYQFGGGGSQQPGVNALLDLLTAKTARDLGLDMTMPKPKKEK